MPRPLLHVHDAVSVGLRLEGVVIAARLIRRRLLVGVAAVIALVVVVPRVKPIYLQRSIGERMAVPAATDDERAMRLHPWSRLPFEDAVASSRFLRDRNAFAIDLVATGKVKFPRAIRLADVAVREAYRRQVPPALVLGVMLTENDELKSTARSRQGALGLMQIHPGPWRSALGPIFGRNLRNDTTNVRYGVYILSHLSRMSGADSAQWRTALLRYNGCVRGTNTRDCFTSPEVVRREVQRSARTTCAGASFDQCVIAPLRLGARRGRKV
jgi:soluble lytic murein transglycosylase-like protein